MALHFISDLHLDPGRPGIGAILRRYLAGPATEAEALYILGDLFEVWAGDDVTAALYAQDIQAIRALSDRGCQVFFLPGNRDFLCGRHFARSAGLRIVEEPLRLRLPDGGDTLLLHGDLLCTDDIAYQRFRRWARNPLVRGVYGLLPRRSRQRVVDRIRNRTTAHMATKSARIMDVNDDTVAAWFDRHAVRRMIHGHTHRPADHQDGQGRARIVLADWSETAGEVLIAGPDGLTRERLG